MVHGRHVHTHKATTEYSIQLYRIGHKYTDRMVHEAQVEMEWFKHVYTQALMSQNEGMHGSFAETEDENQIR